MWGGHVMQTDATGDAGAMTAFRAPLPTAAVSIAVTCAPMPPGLRIADPDAAVLFAPGLAQLALDGAPPQLVGEGDMLLLPPGVTVTHGAGGGAGWLRLTAPRRFLAMPARIATIVPRSTMTEALRHHLSGLAAALAVRPDPRTVRFLAAAVRELLAAATVAGAPRQPRCARRDADMLDRIVAYVDARLGEEVGIVQLCHALGCSRSALYRAAAPAGGLVAMTMQRRLEAVHRALARADEQRSIAELARAHGFPDPSQFSRRFRRAFGVSAGQVRAAATDATPPLVALAR